MFNEFYFVKDLRQSLTNAVETKQRHMIEVEEGDIVQQALKNSGLSQNKECLLNSEARRKELELLVRKKPNLKMVSILESLADDTFR